MSSETLSARLVEIEAMLDRSRRRFEEGSRLVEEAHQSLAEIQQLLIGSPVTLSPEENEEAASRLLASLKASGTELPETLCGGRLAVDPGVEVLAAAADPGTLARVLAGRRPDVLVIDAEPVHGDALALCRRLKARRGAPAVLLYTGRATPGLVIAARAAHVDGVIEKFAPVQQLSSAIRRLAAGERVLPAVSRSDYEAVVERLAGHRPAKLRRLL